MSFQHKHESVRYPYPFYEKAIFCLGSCICNSLLESPDLGSSVAQTDNLLEQARVETSVFTDLFHDRVDLVPRAKGSGKSALYRIFVDFLADYLLESRKVVVAHGVHRHGDNMFLAYNDTFDRMNKEEFVDFWRIYLVSLANEQFIKNPRYIEFIKDFPRETDAVASFI